MLIHVCPCACREGIRVSRATAQLILRLVNSQPWGKRPLPTDTYNVEGWMGQRDVPDAPEKEEIGTSIGNRTAFSWLCGS
jgi:hypothetical protein